jgi:hypothetical protein
MIEFIETALPDGHGRSRLRAEGLPAGMAYTITVRPDGWCEAKSRANGNGSVRYYSHRSYDEAMTHATQWARRKIAEAKRAEQKRSPLLIERELVRLFGR